MPETFIAAAESESGSDPTIFERYTSEEKKVFYDGVGSVLFISIGGVSS